jgi:cytochrome oxidase Cu insertion factor (SCO1/SenC/PrrC family)
VTKQSNKAAHRGGLLLALLVIIGLVLAACGDSTATTMPAASANTNNAQQTPAVKIGVGFTAPDFSGKTVTGQDIKLSDLRGKGVIINFWSVY